MKNIWNSPIMQKLGTVTNLVILNVLWLICCIPVVTVGAATAALYQTVFQYLTDGSDAVFLPFFQAFRQNFKQATLLWLPLAVLAAVLTVDGFYLFANGHGILLAFVVVAAAFILIVGAHLFPMAARFEMSCKAILKTAFSLTMLHLPSSALMGALNIVPIAMLLFAPAGFMRWLPLWIGLWFSLTAYLNGKMLLKIWKKHLPPTDDGVS